MSKQELVDLVDSSGEIVRIGIPRAEAEDLNGRELHLQTVGAVVMNSAGQILVHRRAKGKRFAGCLDHVYGAVDSGEELEEAVRREITEELEVEPQRIVKVREGVNPYDYYLTLFAVITDDSPRDDFNPREVEWAGHLSVGELESGRDSGNYQFTKNFFIDLDAALTAL